MYNKLPFAFCGFIVSFLIVGCKNYSVSVNENVVYTPPSIFKDYQLADMKLSDCVEQTIYDQHITKAEDLTRLDCSNAGITSLAGLETFFALKELNLANNQLVSIDTIGKLGRLERVMLNNNSIRNAAPLLHLLHLKQLDIKNNPGMGCKDVNQLSQNLISQKVELALPAQCL